MKKRTALNVNVSSIGLIGVLFVTLKVLEIGTVATWSWWIVLLPFYIGIAIIAGIVIIGGGIVAFIAAAVAVLEHFQYKKRQKVIEQNRIWDRLKD